jgi:hypothetical protein
MSNLENSDLSEIIMQMSLNIHERCVEIRSDNNIEDGRIIIFTDYAIYPANDRKYYTFHYVVHVDNQTERFFIVTWREATEDEYLESIDLD